MQVPTLHLVPEQLAYGGDIIGWVVRQRHVDEVARQNLELVIQACAMAMPDLGVGTTLDSEAVAITAFSTRSIASRCGNGSLFMARRLEPTVPERT